MSCLLHIRREPPKKRFLRPQVCGSSLLRLPAQVPLQSPGSRSALVMVKQWRRQAAAAFRARGARGFSSPAQDARGAPPGREAPAAAAPPRRHSPAAAPAPRPPARPQAPPPPRRPARPGVHRASARGEPARCAGRAAPADLPRPPGRAGQGRSPQPAPPAAPPMGRRPPPPARRTAPRRGAA